MPRSKFINFCRVTVVCGFAMLISTSAFSQEIKWETDLATATKKASAEGKLVLMHFTADWCRPCKSLETFVFPSSAVTHAIESNVVPLKIDVDLQPELVTEYGISGVPADVVVTPTGRVVTKRNSPTSVAEYARMITGLQKTLNGMEDGNVTLAQNIDEIQRNEKPRQAALAEHNDFRPEAPSYEAPSYRAPDYSNEGKSLARTSNAVNTGSQKVTQNPFFAPPEKQKPVAKIAGIREPATQPLRVSNKSGGEFQAAPKNLEFVNSTANSPANNVDVEKKEVAKEKVANEFFARSKAEANAERLIQDKAKRQLAVSAKVEKRARFALHGKCPVTLLTESKWTEGSEEWGCVHRGRTYLFTSKLHLVEFQRDPDKYSPLLAGYDPVIYHERGELVQGQETNGVFMGKLPDQRIVLFHSPETRARFQQSPSSYIETVRQAMMSSTKPSHSKMR